jgi:2-methylisocitrate lyase-like PEP mutase family enzyme
MEHVPSEHITWRKALSRERPLLLPVAHDSLSAKIIERAGFTAYQVGGFALSGARYGVPDIDLTDFGERYEAVKDIVVATGLPVMVDADDGYGDVKNVTNTVRGFEALGAAALFIEDQQAPKECGHMDDKKVVPVEQMVAKVKAAVAARIEKDFFILARTDAIQPEGVESAIERGRKYLKAGADGIYVEGPRSVQELERIGREFKGSELATSILENGGKTPWVSPKDLGKMGYTMILYPTTLLFRATRALELAAADLRRGRPLQKDDSVDMRRFERIVELPYWQKVERKFSSS